MLETLDLSRTPIDGSGLVRLRGLRRLRQLGMSSTKIDDDALAALDDLQALNALIAATRHHDGFVRFEAAATLGEVAGEEAIEALTALAVDETMPRTATRGTVWSVGENAERAIARIHARCGGSPPAR